MNPASVRPQSRRGVLLLVVVSMLTLFLLLGTTYLVVAARAKQAARAQARLATESQAADPARLLDAVLLKVVRGGSGGATAPPGLPGISGTFESLLADKYGSNPAVPGTATAITPVAGTPLLDATITIAGLQAADLPGRVLTLLPTAGEPTTHRILSGSATGGNAFVVVLDKPARRKAFSIPSLPVAVLVNGREFDDSAGNEAYDAFDDSNVFLSHIEPSDAANPSAIESVSGSVVRRFGFLVSGSSQVVMDCASGFRNGLPLGMDNDGDGTLDGFFLNFGLPPVPLPNNSGTMAFDASVLVVDLDSKFNVNAHGSLASLAYPRGCIGWPNGTPNIPTPTNAPLGSGYGPAETNGAWMFPKASYPSEQSRRMRGNADPKSAGPSSDADERPDTDPLPPEAVISTPFVLWGASGSTQAMQRRPNTSRFSRGEPLLTIGNVEGRYAEGSNPSRIAANATTLPTDQTGTTTWTQLASGAFRLARPGAPAVNDTLSLFGDVSITPSGSNTITGSSAGLPPMWWTGTQGFHWAPSGGSGPRSVYNSPPDLHGRMLTLTLSSTAADVKVPRLMFAKPEWGGGETTDDPYEVRLDPKAARTGATLSTGTNWDNVYGYAELEALLRQYDGDAPQLPKRLLSVLGPASEEARFRVTTDSWDTTMITGSAAQRIRQRLANPPTAVTGPSPVSGVIANEPARGERLNLNRPLTAVNPGSYDAAHPYYLQRQALFKDLFTLVLFVSGTGTPPAPFVAEAAQWAANFVDFCDADSTMTPFEYDALCATSPAEWRVDGDVTSDNPAEVGRRAVVWGVERPEMVIREGFAWQNSGQTPVVGGVVLSLHRPWNATALARVSGSNTSIAAEPCDADLDTLSSGSSGSPTNRVDLGRKAGGTYDDVSASRFPLWRLRIVAGGSTQFIRLDSGSSGPPNEFIISPALTTGNAKPKLGVDESLTIISGSTITTGSGTLTGTASVAVTGSSVIVPNVRITATGTAYLERLSDLGFSLTASGTVPKPPSSSVNGQDIWDSNQAEIGTPADTKIPVRYIVVDTCQLTPVDTLTAVAATPVTGTSAIRTASGTSNAYWKAPVPPNVPAASYTIATGATLTMPSAISGSDAAWFVWPNRPLVSAAELFLVPKRSAQGMLESYVKPTASTNDLVSLNVPLLLDAVHVPTRFAGIHTTINASGTQALSAKGIFSSISPVHQLSSYREPGRVNLNTVTSDDVWNAVVAGPLQRSGSAQPVVPRGPSGANFASAPAKTMTQLLALSSSGTAPRADSYLGSNDVLMDSMRAAKDRNPIHEIYTATRLANTATTRSNVFGVWITVRATIDNNPDSVRLHRAFYIVDRSIPVAHDPGKDFNVWDCVVLRRIIQ